MSGVPVVSRATSWPDAQARMPRANLPLVAGDAGLSVADIRAFDRRAAEQIGVPTLVLMENAGANAAAWIAAGISAGPPAEESAAKVVILCGAGNNGGDGFVIARHLSLRGLRPTVVLAVPHARVAGDARTNLVAWDWIGGAIVHAAESSEFDDALRAISKADVLVDALLGTGASGPPRGVTAQLIDASNQRRGAWRVAIDTPSGLSADDGAPAKPCFRADLTLTLLAPKLGFFNPLAREFVGEVITLPIGLILNAAKV